MTEAYTKLVFKNDRVHLSHCELTPDQLALEIGPAVHAAGNRFFGRRRLSEAELLWLFNRFLGSYRRKDGSRVFVHINTNPEDIEEAVNLLKERKQIRRVFRKDEPSHFIFLCQ